MSPSSPGLFVAPPDPTLASPPSFQVEARGALASHARSSSVQCWFDGLLTTGRRAGQSDAHAVLMAYRANGVDALTELEGFYNLCLVDGATGKTYLLSDPLCSRPLYLYRSSRQVAAAATPVAFSDWGLPMHLSRVGLYGSFRFLHSSGEQTLVQEVERLQPGCLYELDPDGDVNARRVHSLDHDTDPSITLDEATQWMKEAFGSVIEGVMTHPLVRNRPVHLPLTAGLDSRHILGELLDQGYSPDQIRHIHITEKDAHPVRQIAAGLDLPLRYVRLRALDLPTLTHRWMARSGGLVNVHQAYLLHLAQHSESRAPVGFNGYLMDWFLGIAPRPHPSTDDPVEPLWNRTYTRPNTLKALFDDEAGLQQTMHRVLRRIVASARGPTWYKMLMGDMHQRGLHYTGAIDPMLGDDALFVSPGAHRMALRFVRTVPREVAGDRRARLEALRRYFPQLATYPGSYGVPYMEQNALHTKRPGRWKAVQPVLKAIATGFRYDPAPESEHAWLRQIPGYRAMHRRAVFDASLVRDGHLRGWAVHGVWYLLQAGGFQAWTLMSLLSAETAYRLLVKQEPLEDVNDWLWNDMDTTETSYNTL